MQTPRIHNVALGTLVALALAAGTAACKQKQEPAASQEKSLDNFVKAPGSGETQTINHCGYEYDGKPLQDPLATRAAAVTAPTLELRNAAIGVLMRLPENLASPFFAVGGKIVITDKAAELCKGSLTEAESTFAGTSAMELHACWRQPAPGEPPQIVLAASTADIHHGLLRMFAYVFAEFFVQRTAHSDDPEANSATWRQAIDAFKAQRSKVADAFLAELDTPATQEVFNRMESFRSTAGEKFDSFVAAEAVDSFYCSDATRSTFWKQFPKTYTAFIGSADEQALVHQFGPIPPPP